MAVSIQHLQSEAISASVQPEDSDDAASTPPKPRPRSGRIELGDVTPHNIKLLRRLNQVIFPVSYNEKFYKDVLEAGELAKLAYFNDIVVGAVCCRIDESDAGQRRLYIMTLGCLASYRRLGIGTRMLEHVLNWVKKDKRKFASIFLHVQVSNDVAMDFYRRFGFEVLETREKYYKRISPADAFVLHKRLDGSNGPIASVSVPSAVSGLGSTSASTTATSAAAGQDLQEGAEDQD